MLSIANSSCCDAYIPIPSTKSPAMKTYLTLLAISLCFGDPKSPFNQLINFINSSSKKRFDPTWMSDKNTAYSSVGDFFKILLRGISGHTIFFAKIIFIY